MRGRRDRPVCVSLCAVDELLLPDRGKDDIAVDALSGRRHEQPDGACEPVYLYAER